MVCTDLTTKSLSLTASQIPLRPLNSRSPETAEVRVCHFVRVKQRPRSPGWGLWEPPEVVLVGTGPWLVDHTMTTPSADDDQSRDIPEEVSRVRGSDSEGVGGSHGIPFLSLLTNNWVMLVKVRQVLKLTGAPACEWQLGWLQRELLGSESGWNVYTGQTFHLLTQGRQASWKAQNIYGATKTSEWPSCDPLRDWEAQLPREVFLKGSIGQSTHGDPGFWSSGLTLRCHSLE